MAFVPLFCASMYIAIGRGRVFPLGEGSSGYQISCYYGSNGHLINHVRGAKRRVRSVVRSGCEVGG